MRPYSVTVFVQADSPADALLAAGDVLLDCDCLIPGPNYGERYGAALLAALDGKAVHVREIAV